jgi:hypothetical protein
MAGSTKADLQASVLQRSSVGQSKGEESQYIIGPGLDMIYEFLNNYGLAILLFTSVALSFWVIWAVDFSVGK